MPCSRPRPAVQRVAEGVLRRVFPGCSSPPGRPLRLRRASIGWSRKSSRSRLGASRRSLDLVARVPSRPGVPPPAAAAERPRRLLADLDPCRDRISGHGGASLRPRHTSPITSSPAAGTGCRSPPVHTLLYLRVGLDGIGLGRLRGGVLGSIAAVSFAYAYVGLLGLVGRALRSPGSISWSGRSRPWMRVPPRRRGGACRCIAAAGRGRGRMRLIGGICCWTAWRPTRLLDECSAGIGGAAADRSISG